MFELHFKIRMCVLTQDNDGLLLLDYLHALIYKNNHTYNIIIGPILPHFSNVIMYKILYSNLKNSS